MMYEIIGMTIVILVVLFFIKNTVTYRNTKKISAAIFLYMIDCYDKSRKPLVSADDMESYEKTLFRLWDWGYKRIVPRDKFEIIKEFIV